MIDCHVHTALCKHGKGNIADYVSTAVKKKIEILGFSEHAPASYDINKRMTISETKKYFKDINYLKKKYEFKLKILSGLEIDYFTSKPNDSIKAAELFDCDYMLGSVHFISYNSRRISIWDYSYFQNIEVVQNYFDALNEAVTLNQFDAIAHPDSILRAGIKRERVLPLFKKLFKEMKRKNIAYEINCSGITKKSYNPILQTMVSGKQTFPDFELIKLANNAGLHFTIGSDAHEPDKLGKNVRFVLKKLKAMHIPKIAYFENRQRMEYYL